MLQLLSLKGILSLDVLCALLVTSTQAWIFNCNFGMQNNYYFQKDTYTCSVYMFTLESPGNSTDLVDVVGNHLTGKKNADVEYLTIKSSSFTRIPPNIDKFFPNLRGFEVQGTFMGDEDTGTNPNLLTSVTANDLKQFRNITLLSIICHPISSLDDDLFKYTPHIKDLFLYYNNIMNVGQNLLANLVDLRRVNFVKNPCLSFDANGSEAVKKIKTKLLMNCPPIADEDCNIRCSLTKEVDSLRYQAIVQNQTITKLQNLVSDYGKRIATLEKAIAQG